ncbi:hypothetical protein [Acaryochloris marina]|uniref:Uncharacterized protein n=1 Tax=Acaryochloris marina (strain MBIC 11017) TaxID=329726 RepID=B0BZ88_ACAM1|nr:hypothetical protein [Acaryochloris marina]ABW29532.1 conserved hypothetical protein [Acaryochloris marina MBIC11017]BDM78439.1 hypothetical protein AM10699_13080 [Acaryochloris marina MBIC10699]
MTEGLVWLALLFVFIGLASFGWIEYRKVEAYRVWAQSFERAKYDIYTVLGQKGQTLTWGKPTSKGPINLQHCSIDTITSVLVQIDGQGIDLKNPPDKGKTIQLVLERQSDENPVLIPFTDITMAVEWAQYLITVI